LQPQTKTGGLNMQKLTAKEEELMRFFWEKDALFVRDLLDYYDDPKPHFNTLSTIVRGLEEKGFLSHKTYGNTYQYYALIDQDEYSQGTLKTVVEKYFDNSYLHAVSALIKSENISVDDLKQLILDVENQESGGRRQEAGGRRQEAGGRRQEAGVRRQEAGVRSQESGGRRQESGIINY